MTRFRGLSPAALLLTLLLVAGCGTPIPQGIDDAQADELARRMMDASGYEGWKRTGAITWTFADRNNHLWDRRRQLVRVRNDDMEVFVDLRTREGVALRDGERLEGEEAAEAVEEAYASWVNDSFWLTAMFKAFDPGTARSRVVLEDGDQALLVQYASGGVTPGDAYLWYLDERGRPVSWDMWVSVSPIDGVSASWEEWVELSTGAWIATSHAVGPLTIEVTELEAAANIAELVEGPDPFQILVSQRR